MVPGDKVISEIEGIFDRMTKTYCAISKLEFLLEAVRLTYENVSSHSLSGECCYFNELFRVLWCGTPCRHTNTHTHTHTHIWCSISV